MTQPSFHVALMRTPLDPRALEDKVRDAGAGAIVTFTGTTRDAHLGRAVLRLEYEAHAPLAQKQLEKLCERALAEFKCVHVAIEHRLGVLEIGEASVCISVSTAHRGAGFDACRFLIDELKLSVPIFKKEHYADGAPPEWIGPDGKAV